MTADWPEADPADWPATADAGAVLAAGDGLEVVTTAMVNRGQTDDGQPVLLLAFARPDGTQTPTIAYAPTDPADLAGFAAAVTAVAVPDDTPRPTA